MIGSNHLKILFFSTHKPDPSKGGGFHRTYQIHHELITAFGADAVDMPSLLPNNVKISKIKSMLNSIGQRSRILRHALNRGTYPRFLVDEILDTNISRYSLFKQVPLKSYTTYLGLHGTPDLCVVDNTRFLPIIHYNFAHHIPTSFCPQNMDSLDLSAHLLHEKQYRKQCGISLIYELDAIADSMGTFVISKFEKSILDGLGLSSIYYPYLPVGEISKQLNNIQDKRTRQDINLKQFLMVASVNHTTTYQSFKWFFTNAVKYGLPEDIRILVGGRNSDLLGEEFGALTGVQFLGPLEQEDLNKHLIQCCGVLIPQISGFGAVTRIPEMACAGIPMIVSEHAIHAINPPPGVRVVQNDWQEWMNQIEFLRANSSSPPRSAYDHWEAQQPKPLINFILSHLESR